MSQAQVKKSKSKSESSSQDKRMYHFRLCSLIYDVIQAYSERRNITKSAIVRNAIRYAYLTNAKLRGMNVSALLSMLVKKLDIEIQSFDLALASCMKPDAHIEVYKKISLQMDEQTYEFLKNYEEEKGLTGGLSRAEIIRRAVLWYIYKKLLQLESEGENNGEQDS